MVNTLYWLKYYKHSSYSLTYPLLLKLLRNLDLETKKTGVKMRCVRINTVNNREIIVNFVTYKKQFFFKEEVLDVFKGYFVFNNTHMVSIIGDVAEEIVDIISMFIILGLGIVEEKIPLHKLTKLDMLKSALVSALGITTNLEKFPIEFIEYIESIKTDRVEITRRKAKSNSLDDLIKIADALIS